MYPYFLTLTITTLHCINKNFKTALLNTLTLHCLGFASHAFPIVAFAILTTPNWGEPSNFKKKILHEKKPTCEWFKYTLSSSVSLGRWKWPQNCRLVLQRFHQYLTLVCLTNSLLLWQLTIVFVPNESQWLKQG